MKLKPKMIVLFILGILLLIVLLQNTEVVTFQILFWKLTMSRIIFLPLVMVVGIGIGFFLGKKSWNG